MIQRKVDPVHGWRWWRLGCWHRTRLGLWLSEPGECESGRRWGRWGRKSLWSAEMRPRALGECSSLPLPRTSMVMAGRDEGNRGYSFVRTESLPGVGREMVDDGRSKVVV